MYKVLKSEDPDWLKFSSLSRRPIRWQYTRLVIGKFWVFITISTCGKEPFFYIAGLMLQIVSFILCQAHGNQCTTTPMMSKNSSQNSSIYQSSLLIEMVYMILPSFLKLSVHKKCIVCVHNNNE